MIEMLVTVGVILVISAIAIPIIMGTLLNMRLNAAATAAAGAIQTTRFQAIQTGCAYTIAFNQSTATYQVAAYQLTGAPPACANSLTNVGGLIPWSGAQDVTLNASSTLQLNPNGTVSATVGTLALRFSNGKATKTVTVSGVGNVLVTSP